MYSLAYRELEAEELVPEREVSDSEVWLVAEEAGPLLALEPLPLSFSHPADDNPSISKMNIDRIAFRFNSYPPPFDLIIQQMRYGKQRANCGNIEASIYYLANLLYHEE